MKNKLMMLSELTVGMQFQTNSGAGTYRLMAILRKGDNSEIEGFVAKNIDASSNTLRPFIIEGDRPVIVPPTSAGF